MTTLNRLALGAFSMSLILTDGGLSRDAGLPIRP